jgi:hypothetical protein
MLEAKRFYLNWQEPFSPIVSLPRSSLLLPARHGGAGARGSSLASS